VLFALKLCLILQPRGRNTVQRTQETMP
jgi:hypothetical protein